VSRFAVKISIPMHVIEEMTVAALHSLGQMNVFEMDRLLKLMRIIIRDRMIIEIQERSLAIVLKDGAKDPAVTVIIGKLSMLKFRIELGTARRKIGFTPAPPSRGRFRVDHG